MIIEAVEELLPPLTQEEVRQNPNLIRPRYDTGPNSRIDAGEFPEWRDGRTGKNVTFYLPRDSRIGGLVGVPNEDREGGLAYYKVVRNMKRRGITVLALTNDDIQQLKTAGKFKPEKVKLVSVEPGGFV